MTINAKMLREYTSMVETIERMYATEITRITNSMYTDVVVPICQRNGWTFAAGMGTWSFYKDRTPVFEEDVPVIARSILQTPTLFASQDIGSLIEKDYPEKGE